MNKEYTLQYPRLMPIPWVTHLLLKLNKITAIEHFYCQYSIEDCISEMTYITTMYDKPDFKVVDILTDLQNRTPPYKYSRELKEEVQTLQLLNDEFCK